MARPKVEEFARHLSQHTTDSVRNASSSKTEARLKALAASYTDPEEARTRAAEIKDYVLGHLGELLVELEANCIARGIQVHWAADGAEATKIIIEICDRRASKGAVIAKAKSMATEEIHLNHSLEEAGYLPLETDLGEFVIQIDGDVPSHIVTPIIHKDRVDVAKSFARENLGPYTEVPEELAMQARTHLREKFREAEIGISGVNFAIADTGRLVLVENEGNNRLSTTAPKTHIALAGIEKLLPREADLPLFLRLLAASATGQKMTTYVHLVGGPAAEDEPDGPEEVHLILMDNGRSKLIGGEYQDILRCIRCGACLNVCPVYRQVGGHGYGHVYSGPLGAVLAPGLEGVAAQGHLARASSLCGACEEVCPVKIPIPRMLLAIRNETPPNDPAWALYAHGATHPSLWRAGLTLLPMASGVPVPHPMRAGWAEFRELPKRDGRAFRQWWKSR